MSNGRIGSKHYYVIVCQYLREIKSKPEKEVRNVQTELIFILCGYLIATAVTLLVYRVGFSDGRNSALGITGKKRKTLNEKKEDSWGNIINYDHKNVVKDIGEERKQL